VIGFVLLPLANWLVTSAIFWVLTRRLAPVGRWEMCALIGSAWLANMAPGKPGLIGRLAYHRAISGMPVAQSAMVTVMAMLTGGVGIVVALAVQLAIDERLRWIVGFERLALVAGVIVLAALAPGVLLAVRRRRAGLPLLSGGGAIVAAVALRILDMHIWALRYLLAFRLVAHEQEYGVCVVVAGVSQIAAQIPVSIGLREWAVGVSAGVLRPAAGPVNAAAAIPGLTADLLCRAAEVVCAIPVGIVSYIWVLRHLHRKRA